MERSDAAMVPTSRARPADTSCARKRHGVVEAKAVVAAQEVELAPPIHRLGDARKISVSA
jgi:hypothetical protein